MPEFRRYVGEPDHYTQMEDTISPPAMAPENETVEGYVIDIACVRKNARDDLLEKAETHTKECALTGHCVESGYAVVTDDDQLALLDASATPDIVQVVEQSDKQQGHRVRVTRDTEDGELTTSSVDEI